MPVADGFDALNARFLDACSKRGQAILRGHTIPISERMKADVAVFMALPSAPYDACHKVATCVSSLSLVRYRTNDYSVPTRYGHCQVLAKGFVDRVEIVCRGEMIARHVRSYGTADFVYNPLHYLALLERNSKALDQAAPLDEWQLAEFGSERLTGALLDRPTHHVHVLEMNGESFRLATSKKAHRRQGQKPDENTMPSQTNEGGIATNS